jgi:CMP-N-acetylneuraminic acid synthetase
MTKLRILGIVPARAGSKRLPKKNVRLLAGKPLVARAIECALAAQEVGVLDAVAVSSDDVDVLAIARSYPHVIVIERPASLAADTSPAIDYVKHALAVVERDNGSAKYDAVVILQPSSPLTIAADVKGTVDALVASGAPSAASVMKLDHAIHPAKLKRLIGDKLVPYLEEERGRMAAHELPELYVRNCAVYAALRATVDAGKVVDDDCRAYVMPRARSVDINDEMDFAFAQFLVEQQGSQ